MTSPLRTREVRDADADDLAALVGAAYAEYPGCVLDLPGVDADLTAPASAAARTGGRWWVVIRDERAVATIGAGPRREDGSVELKRLYLDASLRGQGLATRLVRSIEAHAAGLGATQVELWSDTRFTPAHHRYQRLGYTRATETRQLHDPSDTTEYRFHKRVTPAGAVPAPAQATPDTPTQAPTSAPAPGGHQPVDPAWFALPEGWRVEAGVAAGSLHGEVDGHGAMRRAVLATPAGTTHVSADGTGRWWQDGDPAPALAGCRDLLLPDAPVTAALLVLRLAAEDTGERAAGTTITAVTTAPTDGSLVTTPVHVRRLATDRWDVVLDEHRVVVSTGRSVR